MDEPSGATSAQEKRVCVQCGIEKDLTLFRKFANMYIASHYTDTCKECYRKAEEARRLQWEAERPQREEAARVERARQQAQREAEWVAEWEAQRPAREAQEREHREKSLAASLAARQVCPRCKEIRTDGYLWPSGHLHFSRYCENCTNATPHSIYKLTCPLLGVVRYVGITVSSLNKRLSQHMTKNSGTERKQEWIGGLRARGLRAIIELIDEAPNERQALLAERRNILHYIQQGCPLVNGEATNAQLVLYAQYSPLNFLEASEEELQRLFQQFSLTETIAQARQRVYQTVRYQKERWHNRYKSVYIAYNAPPEFFGRNLNTLKSEWALRYDHVYTSDELPTGRQERKAILQTVTDALFYTHSDRMRNDLLAYDCRFLLERNVPVAAQYYHPEAFQTEQGILVSVVASDKNKGYPHGKAIMRPLSYTVSREQSLILT